MKFTPAEIAKDIPSFFSMCWAIVRGKHKIPWGTLGMALFCFVYLVSPVDIIPDVLPVLGITDDGTFILLVLAMLHNDLLEYRQSKIAKQNAQEAEIVSSRPEERNFGQDLKK